MCSPCITWRQHFCTKTCQLVMSGEMQEVIRNWSKSAKTCTQSMHPRQYIDLFPPHLLEMRAGNRSNDTLSWVERVKAKLFGACSPLRSREWLRQPDWRTPHQEPIFWAGPAKGDEVLHITCSWHWVWIRLVLSSIFPHQEDESVTSHNKVCFGSVFVLWSEEMLTVTFPTNCNFATA